MLPSRAPSTSAGKGRDLFEVWWAHEQADPDPAQTVAPPGRGWPPVIRSSELRMNLAAKRVPSFLEEARTLLQPSVAYGPAEALKVGRNDVYPAPFLTTAGPVIRHPSGHAAGTKRSVVEVSLFSP